MIISAQISIYPLGQAHLSPDIETVNERLKAAGLGPEVGPMSTLVTGEADVIFASLQHAFEKAAAGGRVVMTVTFSNACKV
jgi:uncharacterized protein YqgV (UPF0045/DUF77 family)